MSLGTHKYTRREKERERERERERHTHVLAKYLCEWICLEASGRTFDSLRCVKVTVIAAVAAIVSRFSSSILHSH